MPATGKPVRISGISMAQIANEKIIAGWDNWDELTMMRSIGVKEIPPAAAESK